MQPHRVVFFGTPDFAVPSLAALCKRQDCQVVAVVTQPDKPKGRGLHLVAPPVKQFACSQGIAVIQPEKLTSPEAFAQLSAMQADLFIVAAYGKILRRNILELPRLGCFNVHASLLPKYRGAAPIHWAVINGDRETGICIMHMDEGMDTGDVVLKEAIDIGPEETTGELHDRLAALGGEMIDRFLTALAAGQIDRTPQDHAAHSLAPKIPDSAACVDWNRPRWEVHNLIRGLAPFPLAFSFLGTTRVCLHRTSLSKIAEHLPDHQPPGSLCCSGKSLYVRCADGWLALLELQPASKKRQSAEEFLCGSRGLLPSQHFTKEPLSQ